MGPKQQDATTKHCTAYTTMVHQKQGKCAHSFLGKWQGLHATYAYCGTGLTAAQPLSVSRTSPPPSERNSLAHSHQYKARGYQTDNPNIQPLHTAHCYSIQHYQRLVHQEVMTASVMQDNTRALTCISTAAIYCSDT